MARCPPSLPWPTGLIHPAACTQRQTGEGNKGSSRSWHRKMQYPFYKSKPGQGLRSSPRIPKATSRCPALWWRAVCPRGTAAQHPSAPWGRGGRSARAGHPCKGTEWMLWHLHCSQESQALASATPSQCSEGSWAGHGAPLLGWFPQWGLGTPGIC